MGKVRQVTAYRSKQKPYSIGPNLDHLFRHMSTLKLQSFVKIHGVVFEIKRLKVDKIDKLKIHITFLLLNRLLSNFYHKSFMF